MKRMQPVDWFFVVMLLMVVGAFLLTLGVNGLLDNVF